jgi:hypothetical protein
MAHVVFIGPNEGAAELARRRPDLFRLGFEHCEYIGHGDVTIVRQENPPPQIALPVPMDEARALLSRALRRFVRGG